MHKINEKEIKAYHYRKQTNNETQRKAMREKKEKKLKRHTERN